MIRDTAGDILDADVEALVNTVNTVGVMGAGLALQVKRKYPAVFLGYASACRRHELNIGQVMVHHLPFERPWYVINFPTKQHWAQPSRLEWIDWGLLDLVRAIELRGIRSIAIPPLGCGLGGLQWADVRGLIEKRLGDLTEVDVVLYAPDETKGNGTCRRPAL